MGLGCMIWVFLCLAVGLRFVMMEMGMRGGWKGLRGGLGSACEEI